MPANQDFSRQEYPRDLAIRVLTQVLSEGQALDRALEKIDALDPKARAWLQEICSGTLRWMGRLELAIDSSALKKKPSGWLRKALLVGSYQLVVQERVHPGSVVSETVTLVKQKEGDAPARFANAVLRKISEHAQAWRELDLRAGASVQEAASWASVPEWLWKRWKEQKGEAWARAYAHASLQRPAIWLNARRSDWKPEDGEQGPFERSWKLNKLDSTVSQLPGFADGEFIVQDVSSQFLIHEVSAILKSVFSTEITALDLCAAPGGKSIALVWSGIHSVIATDQDPKRLELLERTLERIPTASSSIRLIKREEVKEVAPVDLVWVDAPCTGTGILRRHPDVRWLRRESDLAGLMKIQKELIEEAWTKVRPGGFLAYSVCSVLEEEGPGALKRSSFPKARVEREWLLTPQESPYGDGFWAALIRKSS